MKIVFVVPLHTQAERADSIPLGLICLGAELRTHHDYHIIDMNIFGSDFTKQDVESNITRAVREIAIFLHNWSIPVLV